MKIHVLFEVFGEKLDSLALVETLKREIPYLKLVSCVFEGASSYPQENGFIVPSKTHAEIMREKEKVDDLKTPTIPQEEMFAWKGASRDAYIHRFVIFCRAQGYHKITAIKLVKAVFQELTLLECKTYVEDNYNYKY